MFKTGTCLLYIKSLDTSTQQWVLFYLEVIIWTGFHMYLRLY